MSDVIIVALITGGLGLLGNVITNANNQKVINAKIDSNIEFVNHKIDELNKKMDKHNNTIERTYHVEEELKILKTKVEMYHKT